MLSKNPSIPKNHQAAYAGRSAPLLINSRLDRPLRRKKKAVVGVQFMGDLFHKNVAFCDIEKVFQVIAESVHTFLILTKRPLTMLRYTNIYIQRNVCLPDNLWLGVSVEDNDTLSRIDDLLKIRASVLFVSAEPLLEPIGIRGYLYFPPCIDGEQRSLLDWVIAGPETGAGARPCPEGAIENLYKQTRFSCTPFFDKRPDFISREFPKING